MENTEKQMIAKLCKLARQNLVYLSYGEWDGSPETLNEIPLDALLEIQWIVNYLVSKKSCNAYDKE